MDKQRRSHRLLETFYFAYGLVMFAVATYAHDWSVSIVMGVALLGVGLIQQWRKPERALPPLVVPKLTRREQFKANKGSHTAAEWRLLCEVHHWCCAACGQRRPLTKDHIVPITEGGSDDISNLQPLCRPCNSRKNNRTIDYS